MDERRANNDKGSRHAVLWPLAAMMLLMVAGCARMGRPDGGWYDETPPRVIGASPAEGATDVKSRKIEIFFNEFIKVENPSEKVIISPPQLEQAEITAGGKRIKVELQDTLKPSTTYTIDFSDAISDNNEGNPLGNYTYTFSTGDHIDTLEVSGYVLQADNLEPVKGIMVGLYLLPEGTTLATPDPAVDTLFTTQPLLRVARADSRGHFVIRGVAPGSYRVYALQDVDGNYFFNQKSEQIAFNHDVIVPSSKPDVRQDTLWRDTLHIANISRIPYTHFLPDDIVLRAFTEIQSDRYFMKADRQDADRLQLFFTYGGELPRITGLNFDADSQLALQASAGLDTLTYWLRDTALVNQDTLNFVLSYHATDTTGVLMPARDTLSVISRQPYAHRQKNWQKRYEEWQKKQERARKRGQTYDSVMPPELLVPEIKLQSELDPDRNIGFRFQSPLTAVDTSRIHIYARHDSLWYRVAWQFSPIYPRRDSIQRAALDSAETITLDYELQADWRPDVEYSLELDSMAFLDLYGRVSGKQKKGFKVKSTDDYGTMVVTLQGLSGQHVVVQVLNTQDKPVKEVPTDNGRAEISYLSPGSYYLRCYIDRNHNGQWDTGSYADDVEPEEAFYYPEKIECKALWDIPVTWNVHQRPLYQQKPQAITQQKPQAEKKIRQRNMDRARKLGIDYVPVR